MKVLYAASEAVPFCKTGGLADVAGSLPPALAAQGVESACLYLENVPVRQAYIGDPVTRRACLTQLPDRHLLPGCIGGQVALDCHVQTLFPQSPDSGIPLRLRRRQTHHFCRGGGKPRCLLRRDRSRRCRARCLFPADSASASVYAIPLAHGVLLSPADPESHGTALGKLPAGSFPRAHCICLRQRRSLAVYAQLMPVGLGSKMHTPLRKSTALRSPSSMVMTLSSCSIDSTRS